MGSREALINVDKASPGLFISFFLYPCNNSSFFPFRLLFLMFFFLFYSALFSLSPFIFSLPFTCLYHSPFSLTYCRLLVLWLLFITFLLFSLAPFLHIFSSRAFLDISPVGVAYLWPFGTYASFCVCCCDCRVPPKGCFSP